MPGDGLTHGPPATKKAGGSHHRFSQINRHSLRDGFNGTTSPSAHATFVLRAIRVHRIPASRVVTNARTSLFIEAGWARRWF